MSGFEDRRGLGIVRQLLFADQCGELERHVEIGAYGGFPRGVDRNAERGRSGIDVGVDILHRRMRNRRK